MLLPMTSCAALNLDSPVKAVDSFCTTYQRLIQSKGEGTIQALRPVKNRIIANEKTYACNCLEKKPAFCS